MHGYDDDEIAKADAELICDAVNGYGKLSAENAKLRDTILDLMNALDDCWEVLDRVSARAEEQRDAAHEMLERARKALGKEENDADA